MVEDSLERFTSGLPRALQQELAVNALSPAGIVASPGVLFHKLIENEDDPRAEPVAYMAPRRPNPGDLLGARPAGGILTASRCSKAQPALNRKVAWPRGG